MKVRYRRRRRSAFYWFECLLVALGGCLIGIYFASRAQERVYQDYENWALDQQRSGHEADIWTYAKERLGIEKPAPANPPVASAPAEPTQPPSEVTPPPVAPPPVHHPRGGLLGRIIIPRLNVKGIMREGVDDATLARAVGHIPGTAYPGEDGNSALAAHRDTLFRGLAGVRKNDRINIETPDGDYVYEVESTQIVTPNQVEVLNPTKEPVLTLVTCYPFNYVGHAPRRFIVRARRVEVMARNSNNGAARSAP